MTDDFAYLIFKLLDAAVIAHISFDYYFDIDRKFQLYKT